MTTSPFKTSEEFLKAKGPIYTFADNPTIISILIGVSILILLYFIYSSYTIKKGAPAPQNPAVLGLLIATSALSFVNSAYTNNIDKGRETAKGTLSAQVVPAKGKPSGLASLFALLTAGISYTGSSSLRAKGKSKARRGSRRGRP
ncbi:hypothetical protein [Leptolyngbya sp. FACHB-261]|uniref:hypothetical protein n=1 Tax=Leptolyngbya sp. FACHB-261 TaxID=2692806 RepID=UPI001688F53A|nr:hypothetical protein [Leptolyngbya sp. FACHB-261]MBD2102561.1 hypothetical protein [Leptolyngbya sp. FACHB-261]